MKNSLGSFKELKVWQKAVQLVTETYNLTQAFPRGELYGLTSQMRRSSVAIPANIAEGYKRNHLREYIQFLSIASAPTAELETHLLIAKNLNFISEPQHGKIDALLTEVSKMLSALIFKLKTMPSPLNSKPYTLHPKPFKGDDQ